MDSFPTDISDPWRDEYGAVDPGKVAAAIERLGRIWADLDAAAKALEATKATVLAQLTVNLIDDGTPSTQARVRAMASDEYAAHLDALLLARKRANIAKVNFDAAKAGFEATRTAEATRRAEMHTLDRR